MSIIDTPYRAPGVLATELATIDHLAGGRLNVGVGSGWMPEEFAARVRRIFFPASSCPVRDDDRDHAGVSGAMSCSSITGEFADFDLCGFGHKPLQKPGPPIYFSGLKDPKRSAKRIAKYGLQGWIGIQDTPDQIKA